MKTIGIFKSCGREPFMVSNYQKKGESPEGKRRRLAAFKHNSYFGWLRMMRGHLHSMRDAPTTNERTKEICDEMLKLSHELFHTLKERIDEP